MIIDVRRQQQRVTPSRNELLAHVRRVPVHLQRKLVGLDDLRRLGESFAYLRKKGQVSVRRSLVACERGVGDLPRPSLGSLFHQRPGTSIIPDLRAERTGNGRDSSETTGGEKYRNDRRIIRAIYVRDVPEQFKYSRVTPMFHS